MSNCLKLLLVLIQLEILISVVANITCKDTERQALIEFKNSLVDNYGHLSSWDTKNGDANCCMWSGVTCNNRTGHVEELRLHGDDDHKRPLRGTISTSLMKLKHLTFLDLSLNDFNRTLIPEFFGSLRYLEFLNLTQSSFGGKIPYQLGMLSHLWYLDLSRNDLEGVIPHQLGFLSKLEQLWLNHNNHLIIDNPKWLSSLSSLIQLDLTGVSNLNSSLNWLQMIQGLKLKRLALGNCSLSDFHLLSMPPSKLNFSTSIEYLDLTYNKFTSLVFSWVFKLNTSLSTLFLSNNFIEGPIPYDIGIVMRSLTVLDLSSNRLNGTLPHSIGLFPHLDTLFLGMNSLQGIVTQTLFINLTKLTKLQLCENSLTFNFRNNWVPPFQLTFLDLHSTKLGPNFPKWILSQNNLFHLDISDSQISNTIPKSLFCAKNGTTPSLKKLNMSNNRLFGQLPSCLSLLTSLVFLDLSNNKLDGEIPASLGFLVEMSQLILQNNKFTGKFPSLENCTQLTLLDIGKNRISGPIPWWIGDKLQKLQLLMLRENRLNGSLPLSLCDLRGIQILDLSMNNLYGEIPNCINNFMAMTRNVDVNDSVNEFSVYDSSGYYRYFLTLDVNPLVTWKGKEVKFKNNRRVLKIIDLSSNQLSGNIPKEIEYLVQIVSLNLSRNNLSGEIPSNIGNLRALDFLDLSRNHFSGTIPSSLSDITGLGVLDLSYNNLSGKIPIGTQLQSFDPSAYEENPFLCGMPLPKLCPDDETPKSPCPSINQEEQCDDDDDDDDIDDSFFSKGFYISLTFGFVIGFWGVFGSLSLFSPLRVAFFNFLTTLSDKIHVMLIIYVKICCQAARKLIGGNNSVKPIEEEAP